MPSNLEPLLPDLRVARIEHALRLRNPGLPLEAVFATYYQDPQTVELDDGAEKVVPAQAVFNIIIRNPRHPQFDKFFTGRVPMTSWERDDRLFRHSTDVVADPAYHIFSRLVPDAVSWYTNTVELI